MITENLSTLKIYRLTQEQYDKRVENNNIDPNALYLTPEEKQEIEDGADARVWIEISDTDFSTISSDVKAEIEEKVSAVMGDEQNIVFFEVDLFKQVGNGIVKEIREPGVAIKITIKIDNLF